MRITAVKLSTETDIGKSAGSNLSISRYLTYYSALRGI